MEEENTQNTLVAHSETETNPLYNVNLSTEHCFIGMRFAPTDADLLNFFLCKKLLNEPMPYNRIQEVKVYDYSPQFLAGMYPPLSENLWYFFTPRDRKYPRSTRPNRQTKGDGYWEPTTGPISIIDDGENIGSKVALVFYQGKPSKGEKTNWIMYEYKVKETDDVKFDDYVLCRIHEKKVKSSRNQKQTADKRDFVQYPSQILPTQTGPVIDNVGGMTDTKELLIINRSKGLCFPPDFSNGALSEVAQQLMVPPVAKFEVGGVPQYCIEYQSQGDPVIDKVEGMIDTKGQLTNRFKDHCVPTDYSNGTLSEVHPPLMVPSGGNFEVDGVSQYCVEYLSQVIAAQTGPVSGNVQGVIDTKGLLVNGLENHCVPTDSSSEAFSEVPPLLMESPVSSFEVDSMYHIEYPSQNIPAEICPVIDSFEGMTDVNGVLINEIQDRYVQSLLSNGTYSEIPDPLIESPIANYEVDEASLLAFCEEYQANPPVFPLESDAASENVSDSTRNYQDEECYLDFSSFPEVPEDLACPGFLGDNKITDDILKDLDV